MDNNVNRSTRQALDLVRTSYRLRHVSSAPFHMTARGALFRAEGACPFVVRLRWTERLQVVQAEVSLVTELRASGYEMVPRFIEGSDGLVLNLGAGRSACVYHFIEGASYQPLSDRQFKAVLAELPRFFTALDEVDADRLRDLRSVVSPHAAAALRLLPSRYDGVRPAMIALVPELVEALDGKVVVHGDLNAGNFVWRSSGLLGGIVDFEASARGSRLGDIFALVTGTCFPQGKLDLHRLERVAKEMGVQLGGLSLPRLTELVSVRAFAFFGEVNQLRRPREGLELRDLRRGLNGLRAAREMRRQDCG